MQTIWRVHRASAQYTSVALEIHCFGVNIPSHAHASGGWREEIDSGNDVVSRIFKKQTCPSFLLLPLLQINHCLLVWCKKTFYK